MRRHVGGDDGAGGDQRPGADGEAGQNRGVGADAGAVRDGGLAFFPIIVALQRAVAKLRAQRIDALVVSLGVDTFEGDPISRFRLQHDDFLRMGEHIAALGLPTLFVFEGGYAVDAIGVNAVNVLTGFEGA